jgi:hypothetical protein
MPRPDFRSDGNPSLAQSDLIAVRGMSLSERFLENVSGKGI